MTIKRYLLAPLTTDAQDRRVPTLPSGTTGWVCVCGADFPAQSRMLIKVTLPDGTATTDETLVDVLVDGAGWQTGLDAQPLSQAEQDTIKADLVSWGFATTHWDTDGVNNRAKLLWFVLERLAGEQPMPERDLLAGWDVGA